MNWLRDRFKTPGYVPGKQQEAMDYFELPETPRAPRLPDTSDGKVQPPPNSGATAPPPIVGPHPRPQTLEEEVADARSAYLTKTPGRFKSGLIGALVGGLQGLASGNGLAGAAGGALAGGVYGGANPRGLREAEFNQKVLPKMLGYDPASQLIRQRRMEDQKFQQESDYNAARIRSMQTEDEYRRSETEKNRRPIEPKPPSYSSYGGGLYNTQTGQVLPGTAPPKEEKVFTPQLKFGRSKKTGRMGWYNALDDTQAGAYDPLPEPRTFAPKAASKAKTAKKYASMDDIRAAADAAGVSPNQMAAKFKEQGYEIVTTR